MRIARANAEIHDRPGKNSWERIIKKQKNEQGTLRKIVPLALSLAVLAGTFFPGVPQASASCLYSAQFLDLTNWKETLPTGSQGSPTEISQPELATYVKDPYFQMNTACDGVAFRAPVNGVTTSGSGYPRSELREMTNSGKSTASWPTTSGTHTMSFEAAVTSVPKTKRHIVVGQIHDASDDVIVIRLEYPKLFIDINGSTGPTLDANYTLGKKFTAKFVAANGQIKVYYNGNSTAAYTLSKSSSGNYFKAGAYTQSNCSKESDCSSSNYGEVILYKLSVQHSTTTSTSDTTVPTATPTMSALTFEAEAGAITSPMQIVSSSSASNGKYIVQTTDTGTGTAKYNIQIPSTGSYQLRAKVISPNGSSNSVYYSLDGNSSSTWSFPDSISNWEWANGPTVTLSQGTHSLTIKKREKNTKLDVFELKSITSSSDSTSAIDGTTPFEAESGTASGGMHILSDDTTASSGKYVQADSSGSVTYQVNVPTSGTFRIGGLVKAQSGSSDSFYVSIDSKSSFTWTLPYPVSFWTNDVDDNNSFSLSAGTHLITIKYREAGTKIDKVVLVKQ